MAIFQDNLGKLVPECLHSGFYWSKDDEDGGDSWKYQACKAPVKPSSSTYRHPNFYRPDVLPSCHQTNGVGDEKH